LVADSLVLANACLRAEIVPALGAGLARLDALDAQGCAAALLRARPAQADPLDPNLLACYVLLPWSNRIGGGSFAFGGRSLAVPRTWLAEPLPIHGHGWRAPWQVQGREERSVQLAYVHQDGTPYRYRAQLDYRLEGAELTLTLVLENRGATLPFGMGVHPFLPRTAQTRLYAPAQRLWESGPDFLPLASVAPPEQLDFSTPRPLSDHVNHAFGGWNGEARISGSTPGYTLALSADVDHYVLFTPAGQSYFCFEPVDHPINAVNLPGEPALHGLTVLAEGATLRRQFRFSLMQDPPARPS
jgi:aldose 1-epimerase